jgi:uncharacterized protein
MDEKTRSLMNAINEQDVLAVERALADGADPNGVQQSFGDRTPLLVIAAEKGEANIVRLLLNAGADPNARATRARQSMFHDDTTYDDDAGNAIERAIAYDRYDVVEYMLQRGANADAVMSHALSNERILRLLLDRGANPNGPYLGECVVHHSLAEGNLKAVRLLLEYGADPNAVGWGKKRVILNALEYGRLEEARALLAAGATAPTHEEAVQAIDDAWLRTERPFRARALATVRALGFAIERE